MPSTRAAWRIDRAGSLDRLRLVEETLDPPAPGEARIRVRAIGQNFADALACLGLYSATPRGSFVPGLEVAGVVEALGAPVADRPAGVAVGDRVIALTRFGGYASALNVDTRYLTPLPAGWSFEAGAAFVVQTLTAWYGLVRLGDARPGSVVLVQSAAGGVGLQALAILARLGARAVGVVGRESKRDFLVSRALLSRAQVVVRSPGGSGRALDEALEACGARGFDIVFDAVMGDDFRASVARLAPEGRYVLYGAADFMPRGRRPGWARLGWQWLRRPRLDPLAMISENRALLAFNLIWLWDAIERVPAALAALAALELAEPWVGARQPFAAAPAALAELKAGGTVGKSVLVVDPTG